MTDEHQHPEEQVPPSEAEDRPRRSKARPEVESPKGYRATRRAGRAKKVAKRAAREQRVLNAWDRTRKVVVDVAYLGLITLGGVLAAVLVFVLIASAINGIARWNARRSLSDAADEGRARSVRENLLVVGMDGSDPVGFLAIRIDADNDQVFGVAIPDGAFIEVPGQGFERIADSLDGGPDVAVSAVSNYLTVPFEKYAIVSADAYRAAMKDQNVAALTDQVSESNLSEGDLERVRRQLKATKRANVALVPLPVKPIKLGDQTYFEPQRDEVADLLKSWWGIDSSAGQSVPRVIVYNGAGVPGIAGIAAQQLIRAGVRVVDTKNADRFNYKQTHIVVQRGDTAVGEQVRKVLGAGKVIRQPSDQDVADVIVVIGKDYKPPKGGN